MQYKQKGQDRTAAGKLVSVGPEFVVLEDGANSFAVPLEGITRMQVLELPLRVHVAGDNENAACTGPYWAWPTCARESPGFPTTR